MHEFLLSIISYLLHKDMSFSKILSEVLGRFWGRGRGVMERISISLLFLIHVLIHVESESESLDPVIPHLRGFTHQIQDLMVCPKHYSKATPPLKNIYNQNCSSINKVISLFHNT